MCRVLFVLSFVHFYYRLSFVVFHCHCLHTNVYRCIARVSFMDSASFVNYTGFRIGWFVLRCGMVSITVFCIFSESSTCNARRICCIYRAFAKLFVAKLVCHTKKTRKLHCAMNTVRHPLLRADPRFDCTHFDRALSPSEM